MTCYVGIVPFYLSFFEDKIFLAFKLHKDDYFVSMLAVLLKTANPNILAEIVVNTFSLWL